MNKEIERLWKEKEDIMKQIKPLEEKIDSIDERIEEIQESCEHIFSTTLSEFTIGETKLDLTIDECVKCGIEFCR